MKDFLFLYVLFILIGGHEAFAQSTETIKIRKESIYFFQKGQKRDSISNHSLFYLLVPDSLKKSISIHTDNGQFMATANDSLVQLNYVPGLKYESLYEPKEMPPGTSRRSTQKPILELKTLVNGVSSNKRNQFFIRIVNKTEDKILLENIYYLDEK